MIITIKSCLSLEMLRRVLKELPSMKVEPIKKYKGCYYHFLESDNPSDFFVAGQRIGETESHLQRARAVS